MAAKKTAGKKAASRKKKPRAKSVRASKTIRAKSGLSSAQNRVYRAAFLAALRNSYRQQRANTIASQRMQAAANRAASRSSYLVRTQSVVIRNTYLQARYGIQKYPIHGIPLPSSFRKQSSVRAYLQARYGQKTYGLTKGGVSVRIKFTYPKHKVVSAGTTRQSRTSRSAYAAAYAKAVAHRSKPRHTVKGVGKRRKAPGGRHENLTHTQWITAGNDQGAENCVAVAIANSLLYSLGYRVTDEQVSMVKYDRLNKAMWMLVKYPRWWPVELFWYKRVDGEGQPLEPGDIVGFETEQGSHCGVLMPGNMVVSWGEIVPLESPVDEAWRLTWRITG